MITADEIRKLQRNSTVVIKILQQIDLLIRSKAEVCAVAARFDLYGISRDHVNQVIRVLKEAGFRVQVKWISNPLNQTVLLITW